MSKALLKILEIKIHESPHFQLENQGIPIQNSCFLYKMDKTLRNFFHTEYRKLGRFWKKNWYHLFASWLHDHLNRNSLWIHLMQQPHFLTFYLLNIHNIWKWILLLQKPSNFLPKACHQILFILFLSIFHVFSFALDFCPSLLLFF